jgi:hypothetical protein
MALIAFDLDNTLGYFSHVGAWADFFSIETLENSFNLTINPKFKISPTLKKILREAEANYNSKLLANPQILRTILRPNLDAMITPLIKAKQEGLIRAICIYSNTWNTYSVHLGKFLIETLYECPNLFDIVIDASDPIRRGDWELRPQGQQIKTYGVLKEIFRKLCKVKGSIAPSDILFIDERLTKHNIAINELEGLVYLKPSVFSPKIPLETSKQIFRIGLQVLEESGLASNTEYLDSDIFHCLKFGEWDREN